MSTGSTKTKLLKQGTPNFDQALERVSQSEASTQQPVESPDDIEFWEQIFGGAMQQTRALYKKFKNRDFCCRKCGAKI